MKAFILIILSLCLSVITKAQSVKMTIEVKKVQPGKGTVVVNIYDKKEVFLKTSFLSKTQKADQSTLKFIIDLPKKGTYAITVFQDLDNNKKLNQDWLGIPEEPVGYGNNFKPSSKPKFNECSVTVNEDTSQVISLL
ncbi:DUF2141 domain-containing protein [Pedobacter cryoconitis]|uniref:Uncharacterized protein (DUF2141 family) n=1 Tax=Pedobacter cryoconitis TaxID=188932 RepID=A0A7X0MHG3_9SPHI|nr:DUF2141 domain-containing protein [Pedobacter cryoconitis]MBB6499337.1 uncharacterized protein (DUF2141 family) [Pedobacter cryoconitis]